MYKSTFWVRGAEVLPKSLASPLYTAVMMSEPNGNCEVVKVAPPETRFNCFSSVVPFRNWTEPVGVPAGEVTVAVNVTLLENFEGLGDEVRVVVVAAITT